MALKNKVRKGMGKKMKVCERCLWAIESREGNQRSEKHWIEDEEEIVCEWCENVIENDSYYEI